MPAIKPAPLPSALAVAHLLRCCRWLHFFLPSYAQVCDAFDRPILMLVIMIDHASARSMLRGAILALSLALGLSRAPRMRGSRHMQMVLA